MPAKRAKAAGNAPGKYYVDERCIGCTLCHETAPGHFRADAELGHDYVFRQPQNQEELRLCMEAKKACPMDAIQDDGLKVERPEVLQVAKTPCGEMQKGFPKGIHKGGAAA